MTLTLAYSSPYLHFFDAIDVTDQETISPWLGTTTKIIPYELRHKLTNRKGRKLGAQHAYLKTQKQ